MIRHAKTNDARAIADIYNEYVLHSVATFETEAVTETEMRRRITDISASFPYLVAEKDGRILGYAYAHLWQERAAYRYTWETTVYVSSQALHQGIGLSLMAQLIEACRRPDCHVLIACITHGNAASYALHDKLGFKQVAYYEKVGEKFGLRLDVTNWELILQP